MLIAQVTRDSDGKLPSFAWPGGYPIVYLVADGECLCPKCANAHGQTTDPADKQWHLIGADIHWEGEPIQCAHCNAGIESAYGIPDDTE